MPCEIDGFIDVAQPVELGHPLNRGLVSWWLPIPGWSGGDKLRDLCRRNDGTLTNGPTWQGGPNGLQSLAFDGTNDYVDCGTVPGLSGSTAATFAVAVYRASAGIQVCYGGCGGMSAFGGNRFSFIWTTDGYLYVSVENATSAFGRAALSGTGWRHVAACYDGAGATNAGRLEVYVDGQPQSLTFNLFSCADIPAAMGNPTPWRLGMDSSDRYGGGQITDARVYASRALPAADVMALYEQTLRGHPDTLRRWTPRAYLFTAPAAGGFQAAWARGSNVVLGMGGR